MYPQTGWKEREISSRLHYASPALQEPFPVQPQPFEATVAEDVLNAAGDLDPDNVEYKFVNRTNSQYSSGGSGDPAGIEWRNVDNVAGLFSPDGVTPQTPEQYWANRGIVNAQDEWYIIVRDRSPNQNRTWYIGFLPDTDDPIYPEVWATVNEEIRTISTPAP